MSETLVTHIWEFYNILYKSVEPEKNIFLVVCHFFKSFSVADNGIL